MTHPAPTGKSNSGKEEPTKKQKQQPAFVVTPGHDLLLRGLGILHRATAEQLTRLYYKPGMLQTVKSRLSTLAKNGYVLPLFHPSIRLPYVYTLDRKGLNYLTEQGSDIREYFRPSEEAETAKNFLFREHMLAISDLLITALLFEKTESSYRVETMLHERYFKNHPIKTVSTKHNNEEAKVIVPDAYVAFAHMGETGHEEIIPVVWEIDRGTEEQKFFRKRIRAYIAFLKSRLFKTLLGVDHITIAFATTKDQYRVKLMREWTQKELTATSEPSWLSDLFLFTDLSVMDKSEPRSLFLAPVWYPPADETPVSLLGE